MISVIICSANEGDLDKVKSNIRQTIGVPYEVISINNADASRGICEVYNWGAAKAKYDILCFMHEDIEMITERWGEIITNLFHFYPGVGLVGIAGGGYKSITPSGWYNYDLEFNGGAYSNVLQGRKREDGVETFDHSNPQSQVFSKVACLDGCWLCMPKTVWMKHPFDEKLLAKFHGYDLDLSLAVNQDYEVVVTFEVLLRHFSEGNYDLNWFDEILKVHKKWSRFLPFDADQLIKGDLARAEKWAYRRFLQAALNDGIRKNALFSVLWSARHSRLIGLTVTLKLAFALVKMKPKEKNALSFPVLR